MKKTVQIPTEKCHISMQIVPVGSEKISPNGWIGGGSIEKEQLGAAHFKKTEEILVT